MPMSTTSPAVAASVAASAADAASLQLNMETLSQSSGVRALGESFFEGMEVDLSMPSPNGGGDGQADLAVDGDKVVGLSLVLLRDYSSLCGGEVGSTGCGCVLSSHACSTMKHRHMKVTWPSVPSIFLKGHRGATAYLEPALAVSFVDAAELPGLLQSRFCAETWATKVASFECATKFGTSVGDAQTCLEAAKEIFKTPARSNKRQNRFMDSLSDLQKSSAKTQKMDPIVPIIEEKLAELAALKGDASADSELTVSDVLVLLVDLARRVDNQTTASGARDELAKASSEYVKSELFDVNLMLGALEGDISGLKALLGKRPTGLKVEGNLFEIVSNFEKILKLSGAEESATAQSPLAQRSWLSSVLLPYKNAIENLAPRVSGLENGVVGGKGGADANPPQLHRAPRPSIPVAGPSAVPSDGTWERGIEEQLASLTRMATGTANLGDKGVNFGGQVFSNRREMIAWLESKEGHSNLTYSVFPCHLTLLHRVYTIITGGQRDLRDVKVLSDLKVRDHCVNAAQALARGGLPLIFKGDSKNPIFTGLDTGGPKARFQNIPTFARFGETNDQDAMRHKILSGLSEVHKTIQNDIQNELHHAEVRSLAAAMAMRTYEFCQALIQFLSDTYQDYFPSFGCTTKTWDFVCLCVEKVLTSEFAEARSLAPGLDLAQKHFGMNTIWCSLRIVAVQERFMEVGIANHPILSSTISRYLIKNAGFGGVEQANSVAIKNAATIAAMEATISELKSQVKSATSLADKANNALKKVAAEVTKLGKK